MADEAIVSTSSIGLGLALFHRAIHTRLAMNRGKRILRKSTAELRANIQLAKTLYESGESLATVASRFHCTRTALQWRLIEEGAKIRHPNKLRVFSVEDLERAEALYTAGHSIREVAALFDADNKVLSRVFRRAGFHVRKAGLYHDRSKEKLSGENNRNWKGGQYTSYQGYRWVIQKDHPCATNHGYVREHRLVVEAHLRQSNPSHPALQDGYLRPDWDVHHKNRDKLDNRLENLEVIPKCMHTVWSHYEREIQRLQALLEANGIAY